MGYYYHLIRKIVQRFIEIEICKNVGFHRIIILDKYIVLFGVRYKSITNHGIKITDKTS